MTRMKLTSPGVLLILAVLAAGGIFLLDLFFLSPHIDSQKWAALREEAGQTEHAAQLVLQSEETSLLNSAAAWADNPAVLKAVEGAADIESGGPPARALAAAGVQWAWITDPCGDLVAQWSCAAPRPDPPQVAGAAKAKAAPAPRPAPLGAEDAEEIARALAAIHPASRGPDSGLMRLWRDVALFARYPIYGPAGLGDCRGHIYLARPMDAKLLGRLGGASGGEIVVVSGDHLPRGVLEGSSAPQTVWLAAEDCLAVAWLCRDAGGGTLGYFLATVPVVHIHRQAAASRRMVLIILSLSVGLALLVILGSHMLITGPVVRLLTRLQHLESGKGSPKSLAHNLHGEPLMLARRLENAFEKLAHISKTDQLTGLANRRHFEEVLEAFYHQARRYNRPLSVIVMDVDFFKAVNDAGGHQAGDEVLRSVALAVEEACRKADLPARFGGDEFAVLLPETAAADAEAVAERIRNTLAERPMHIGRLEFSITASLGIADLNAGEMDGPGAMMGLADRALYAAKQLGRNRCLQAHDLHIPPVGSGPKEDGKIDVLSKKLAGLDNRFKDLFVLAFDQVMDILQQRDPHMADHTRKVQHYAALIAREMELPNRVVRRIEIAAVMHDLGMVALPDSILLCPTELDEAQMRIMRRHPLLSVRIMERMEFLEQEIPAVRYHHERWDGRGYPEGVSGAAIPLTARILAVADCFDAMTSPRTFRSAMGCAEALGEIHRASGAQFDPAVVDAFMSLADRVGQGLMHVPGVGGDPARVVQEAPAMRQSAAWRASDAAEAVPTSPEQQDG